MGSAKVSKTNPQIMENRSIETFLVKYWNLLKNSKKEKGKEKKLKKNEVNPPKNTPETHKQEAVASILEPFEKLNIQNEKRITETNEKDELDNFTIKVIEDIEDDRRRIYSQSSEDSGFAEVADTLEKLTINDKAESDQEKTKDEVDVKEEATDETDKVTKEKKKKVKQIVVPRGPLKGRVTEYSTHPYVKEDNAYKPINQINKQTLSGGHVIVNPTTQEPTPDYSEPDAVFPSVAKLYREDPAYWEDLLDVITKDGKIDDLLSLPQINETEDRTFSVDEVPESAPISNFSPIEQLSAAQHMPYENFQFSDSILHYGNFPKYDSPTSLFPSPPHSENVSSPLSESQTFYASNSEYALSPERSSPINNSDFEKYQEILPSFDESYEKEIKRDSDRASAMSQSSMTMKNYKDLQKEISNGFSKKECCMERIPTKKIFEEHIHKLKSEERKNLCMAVSKLDLKMCYGILHHVLLSLSKECEQEDLQYALFALICQRVLAQSPALFVGEFGLSILKAAALRCPHRPILTRHIVHCVYSVLRGEPKLCVNECVFHEVDAQGDNLVIACARGGDAYALVLAELTRSEPRGDLPPLFRLHHANSDGYTALHVACRQHSASNSHLHVVHVLLDHANADIWKGDIKGGDTALHLAVNSATCCLRLVMLLFKQLDRKLWKKLAHAHNMSSVTPLDNARSATKSTTRRNYPHEVLDFLKKCR